MCAYRMGVATANGTRNTRPAPHPARKRACGIIRAPRFQALNTAMMSKPMQPSRFPAGLRRSAAAAALAASLLGVSCQTASVMPPPVIVLLVDTLRYDYLGCDGFQGPVSPNVDALARESYVFQRCYAPAPWTKPSIASLFTSLYPLAHGVTNHQGGMWGGDAPDLQKGVLRPQARTLAEGFRDRGYLTAAFVGNPWLTWEYGFDQGFDVYASVVEPPADRITLEAERWLGSRDASRPFFLYLHFMDVHGPYDAPDSAYEAVRGSPSLHTDRTLTDGERERISDMLSHSRWARDAAGNLTPETASLEVWRGRYAAGVRDFDDRVGPFLERLRRDGILDRAWVILTSDHGEELFEHGNWNHGYGLYEHDIRVPLIVRPPGGLTAMREVENVVGLVDLYPTLLHLTGVEPAEAGNAGGDGDDVKGKDLSPFFDGTGPGGSGIVFSSGVRNNPRLWSLVAGAYKLILNGAENRYAFFDVARDPAETVNLAPRMPDQAARMRVYLDEILEAQKGRHLFDPSPEPMSAERRELLRSLGYMN
jgi:arylsulfatase A-like enzyme